MELQGFQEADSAVKKRLIARVMKRDKQGGTHFALTTPGPIAFFDMDRGTEGVIHKFIDKKEIKTVNYREMASSTQAEHELKWELLKTNYYTALEHPAIRTLVFDTDTEAWEMIRLAKFGDKATSIPRNFGAVNKEFKTLIDHAFESDKNVIFISKLKKRYVDPQGTGNGQWDGTWEPSGFNDFPYLVQANIEVWHGDDGEFNAKIINSRHSGALAGEVISGDCCNFPFLATLVFPDTSLEEWE